MSTSSGMKRDIHTPHLFLYRLCQAVVHEDLRWGKVCLPQGAHPGASLTVSLLTVCWPVAAVHVVVVPQLLCHGPYTAESVLCCNEPLYSAPTQLHTAHGYEPLSCTTYAVRWSAHSVWSKQMVMSTRHAGSDRSKHTHLPQTANAFTHTGSS